MVTYLRENTLLASKLLVYRMPATRAQVLMTSGMALSLFLLFIAMPFFQAELFQTQQPPARQAFVAISSVILVMADWIIATLLFAQARVLRARPLHMLAAGFFLAGLLMTLRILSLPDAMGPAHRQLDATYNLPLWFYCASHIALPLAIMPYAWFNQAADRALRTGPPRHRLPGRHLTRSMILTACVILAFTIIETSLPRAASIFLAAFTAMLLIIAGMIALARKPHSELDLWLLLMLWGWFLEMALIALHFPGYTVGWYAARTLGLLSGLFVLVVLLSETSKLYAQSVLLLMAQTQEREHRFLIRDVMSASIAHELRQPLSAILINAQVAREIAAGQGGELAALPGGPLQVLDDIIASSQQANDILESTRAMFGRGNSKRTVVDPAVILKSTLAMIASSARAQNVSAKLAVEGQPGLVVINRLQFQQALLNLFQNALEALSQSAEPNRSLLVRCSGRDDKEVVIRVEDNGPGIAPADRNRIFDAFFSTRPGGTGMGLLIARSVIRAHGGKLNVEARSPAGTAFTIHLPCARSAMPARSAAIGWN